MNKKTAIICSIVALAVVGAVITASLVSSAAAQRQTDSRYDVCLNYVGFYDPSYSTEQRTYLALGCKQWAENQG